MSTQNPKFSDFFTLFEQPVAFDIDASKLDDRLRQLQRQYHPDKLGDNNNVDQNHVDQNHVSQSQSQTNNSSQSTGASDQNSALINHAYHVLANPDSRANYLLEISGRELNNNDTIADLDFLDDAMDMRIALDEATAASEFDKIKTLHNHVDQRIDKQSERFKNAYQTEDWVQAIDSTQKLKFLVKLKKDMDKAIDELHQQHDNDDDLYL